MAGKRVYDSIYRLVLKCLQVMKMLLILRKFNYVVHIYKDLLITQITREEVIV